ncbi:tetratricopeptide repeat protein [Dokdonella sp.]|uniref:tetratricopeptide repeat protein n=1 Tax=Dokdonella sp. TaxID=2291710 RepID=UPI0035288234
MPILGVGLHVVIAVLFAMHVLRTGQERYWLLVLFLAPLFGSLVYALVVFIPDLSRSRSGRKVMRGLRDTLNPGRELREAQLELEHSPTIANRERLADALQAEQRHAEAIEAYREALSGLNSDDADLQVKLARALLDNGQAAEARKLLEALQIQQPEFKSSDGRLIHARAVAAAGDRDLARKEFDSLLGSYAGMEARARYVAILNAWGEHAAAKHLIEESLQHAERMPAGSRKLNKQWIRELERAPTAPE